MATLYDAPHIDPPAQRIISETPRSFTIATSKKQPPVKAPVKASAKPPIPRSLGAKRELAQWYYDLFVSLYPDAACALKHRNPFELLVSTILSAQCTDVRVNMVTPALFKRWPGPQDFAKADVREVEAAVRSTGFFRNKAKNIIAASAMIVEKHGGNVPQTMEQLTALPGVARKTANVVLGNAFGINVGMVVDTHIARLSGRLGLSKASDPVKIERDLVQLLTPGQWTFWSHLLISHGRAVCVARKPRCAKCPAASRCPRVGVMGKS